MLPFSYRHPAFWAGSLLILLILTTGIYWQGLQSPFIFDDIPNLSPMGQCQYLGFWHDVGLFLLQGDSGPTGRPLSLISFYLNDTAWRGTSAASFKYTNVMLHLLNGVFVFWLALKLAELTKASQPYQSHAIALLASAIWLLHPIQINTVLYVVQRMTELSTLFMLSGILCYLHGRKRLSQASATGWGWLLLGGGINLVLSILSKETGVILIIYILVVEYTIVRPFHHSIPKHLNLALAITVWLPFLLLVGYLLKTGLTPENYAARPFNADQRLLTEARVLWDYLNSIFLPSPSKSSLFHDDFVISQHWLEPLTTLPAVLGIFSLLVIATITYHKQPIITFAITWFLGGHLLESTTIPLEIYFEHRNYLPLFGIAFFLAWYGLILTARWRMMGQIIVSGFTLTAIAVTLLGILQWTNPVQMVSGWLQDHPTSQRTLEALDALIGEHIKPETRVQLLNELNAASDASDTSSYVIFRELLLQCQQVSLTKQHLQDAAQRLQHAGFVNAAPKIYADIVNQWKSNQCGTLSAEDMTAFSQQLQQIPNLQYGNMLESLHYWQAEIKATQGNLEETMYHLDTAYQLHPNLDTLFLQIQYLSSAGLYETALEKLQQAQKDLCKAWRSCTSLQLRESEIEQLTALLQKHLQEQQEVLAHEHPVNYSARKE